MMQSANYALDTALAIDRTALKEWQIPPEYLATHIRQVIVGTFLVGTLMFLPYLLLGLVLSILLGRKSSSTITGTGRLGSLQLP